MALLDRNSCECTKSELDLFLVKPTQTVIEKAQWIEYHPVALIGDHGPIEFRVEGSEELYVDLAETLLHVKVKVVKGDGTALAADEAAGPANLFLHSLFSQVDVFLNQRLVSSSSPTYPYRAMIETLLSYDAGAKNSQLQSAMYYKDVAGRMDEPNPEAAAAAVNQGLKARASLVRNDKSVDLIGRLHCDIFQQNKYLINGVDLQVKCVRSSNSFCLLASEDTADYKVLIQSATLMVRKVQVAPSVRLAHEKALLKSTAKYPIDRVLVNVYSVPEGNMNMIKDNLFHGQLPNKVVVAMVDSDAYNGNYKKSPFNFKHNQLTAMGLYVNGEPMPGKPLETKFTAAGGEHYIKAYLNMFQGNGAFGADVGNHITREDFAGGYALFAFDLTPDLSDGDHLSLVRRGNLKLEMRFGEALPRTVMVLVYAQFDNLIEITRERTVLFDYSD